MSRGHADRLVETRQLKVHFDVGGSVLARKRKTVRAVDGVDLVIERGEIFGLVGESGSGKSSFARALLGLAPVTSGQAMFRGQDLAGGRAASVRRHMQMVFQDPYSSLDPRMTVRDIVAEPLRVQNLGSRQERVARVQELMRLVGLPAESMDRYPHEFSGGQRQRIGIACALSTQPDFIVCDEAVSALDVSIQAQILNLLLDLRQQLGLTLLFISHDLNVVRIVADRVAVMYLGRVAESGSAETIFNDPRHPYTQALLSAIPVANPRLTRATPRKALQGEIPSPFSPPSGCGFRTRCPYAAAVCAERDPATEAIANGHVIRCHRWRELNSALAPMPTPA